MLYLGWHTQQHVDVVRHRFALDQFHVLLAAQLPQDLPDRTGVLFPKNSFSANFGKASRVCRKKQAKRRKLLSFRNIPISIHPLR